MRGDEALKLGFTSRRDDALHRDDLTVDLGFESAIFIQEVTDTTSHTRTHVAAHLAERHNTTTRHVLAAVITGALHDSLTERVTHGETLTRATADEHPTTRGTVQARVTSNARRFRSERRVGGRHDGDFTTAHALRDIIVRFTHKTHIHTTHNEATERLTTGTLDV